MAIDVVINELSLSPLAPDEHTARQRMSLLIRTLLAAHTLGIRGEWRLPGNFHATQLAPGYFVDKWKFDKQADRDERQYFLRKATKIPFLEDCPDVANLLRGYEFRIGDDIAEGCGVAYLLDALAVSLQSENRWTTEFLSLAVLQLTEDGNLRKDATEITHACVPEHLQAHHTWIQQRLQSGIRNGPELWLQRKSVFSSLVFCDCVEEQMNTLAIGTPMLRPVISALFHLEDASQKWTKEGFDPKMIQGNVSPESAITMQRFDSHRTFNCPDGEHRTFEWHYKIALNAWRIYFLWDDSQPGKLTIGYIGRHLPTANDPT